MRRSSFVNNDSESVALRKVWCVIFEGRTFFDQTTDTSEILKKYTSMLHWFLIELSRDRAHTLFIEE